MNPKSKIVQLLLREVIPSMIFQNQKMTIFSAGQSSIGQTPLTLLLSIPQVNILPLISLLFIHFYFSYLCLLQVSPWSTLLLKAGAVPSSDLSFLDQATPHVEPPSRPPTELDVAVACSTISHLLSLDLLSLSTI